MAESSVSATTGVENTGEVVPGASTGERIVQGNDQQPEQPARPGAFSIIKTLLVRMFFIYMVSSFFRRGTTPSAPQDGSGESKAAVIPAKNLFDKGLPMDMYVYISEDEIFSDFNNKNALFWLEEEMVYGDWQGGLLGDGTYEKKGTIPLSEAVQNNGSIYLHMFIVKAGNSPDPSDADHYSSIYTLQKTKRLNRFKKRKYHTMKNLLTGETSVHPDLVRDHNDTLVEVLSHWHPNLTVNIVEDYTPWTRGSVPAPLDEFLDFVPGSDAYYPIVYFNEYWNFNKDYMPINNTVSSVNLSLTFTPMSLFKWQMYASQAMRNKWYSFMGEDMMEESDEDQDSLKTTLTETNPYLLAITVIVSIIHSVFEFLAFKNDIQFWRNRKSLEGLSVRSVFFNVFQSLIVLLYVLDNETNFVIRVSVFIGLGIELWKIHKVLDIQLDRENKLFGILPRVKFADKSTYTQSQTKKYDQLAFKYLSWLLFPLLGGYAVYSLLYMEQKGWYSWVLSLLYGFLLTFGFIMMTPQLFINYKLKSVAHLPWRMLTYKALNTFIDDLFAFVIKMPTLYRLGCFRDDIVFVIFLYQRYIYRVDPKRVNEFGVSAEMLDEAAQNGGVLPPEKDEAIENTPKPEQEKKDD